MAEDIGSLLKDKRLFFDGSMGVSLKELSGRHDLPCVDVLNLEQPKLVQQVHAGFLSAGCDIIETNTFNAHTSQLADMGLGERTYDINQQGAKLALETARSFSRPGQPRFVSGSMGPGTHLPSLEAMDMEALCRGYCEQALGLLDGGVDLLQIETCQDLLQAKTALRGVRRAFHRRGIQRPVIVQVTVDQGTLLPGTSMRAVIAALQAFPLLALGLNCGSGPKGMKQALQVLAAYSPVYISLLPNAGLPEIRDGQPVYTMDADGFAREMADVMARWPVHMAGGCCGTQPAHIRALIQAAEPLPYLRERLAPIASLSSLYQVQEIDVRPKPLIAGERTNSNGSRAFKRALLAGDIDGMVDIARGQEQEGAHLLDVSVAIAGREEARDLARLCTRLHTEARVPLMFDSTNPEALEKVLQGYAGRAVINSINLEDGGSKARRTLALAREYGAAVVGLTIDEQGMAKTREHKLAVAKRLRELVLAQGLKPQDLFVDPLTFTLASGDPALFNAGVETLAALRQIKRDLPDVFTMLGVSNISYGLPSRCRKVVNALFLYHAVQNGLDAAIFHAGKLVPVAQVPTQERGLAEDLIFNRGRPGHDPLAAILRAYAKQEEPPTGHRSEKSTGLAEHVLHGRKKQLDESLQAALREETPLQVIHNRLLPAMKEVGEQFNQGAMPLPFVLRSAEVMHLACEKLAPLMRPGTGLHKGSLVLATVKGDIHDIGKNLVAAILSSHGLQVRDLGINQDARAIVAAVKQYAPDWLGLSGLLVQSALAMKDVLLQLAEENLCLPVFCGGAALSADYVNQALAVCYPGDVIYGKDAFSLLRYIDV